MLLNELSITISFRSRSTAPPIRTNTRDRTASRIASAASAKTTSAVSMIRVDSLRLGRTRL